MSSFPGISAAPAVPVAPAAPVVSAPLFRPFASEVPSSVPVSLAPPSFPSAPLPPFSSAPFAYPSGSFAPFAFGFEDLPDDMPPDALPRDPDPTVPLVVPDQFRSEFCRMLPFIVDLFPQAVGSPVVPPWALFEDFFGSSSLPSLPIFLNWFERVHIALADADTRLASFIASGCSDFAFLLPRNSLYAVHGEFALGHAAQVNPSLLSLFEHSLKPSHHLGLSICEAAALEASFRSHSEALSHSMWVLSGLLAFVRLQQFAPVWSPPSRRV